MARERRRLCEDEGCPHHGSAHHCVATPLRSRALPPREGIRQRKEGIVEALHAIRVLRTGCWRINDLAVELGLHRRRTCYRLLESLERAGVRVDRHRHPEGSDIYLRITREAVYAALVVW